MKLCRPAQANGQLSKLSKDMPLTTNRAPQNCYLQVGNAKQRPLGGMALLALLCNAEPGR